jgi:DNA-binding transcriptional regulator YhcF (GntR family)
MAQFDLHISETAGQTKLQQLVHSITEAISNGILKNGDTLPSVNQLSTESGYSRDTVFKAYAILKERNIIVSAPQKGYYVASETFKVLMLLDDFSAFKEQLYQSFRQNLPEEYAVDLLFHHYNEDVFIQLIENSLGRYSHYLVMNPDNRSIHPILNKIDANKLLILDMGTPLNNSMNFLIQDFSSAVSSCLEESRNLLKKYNELIIVYEGKTTPHPEETVAAVAGFCSTHKIPFNRVAKIRGNEVKKGQAYFVIRDADLVEVIKTCRKKHLTLGKDVGILSYNDTPMKQIVGGGISVVSTNFSLMGEQAAEFVKTKQKITKILPTSLLLRESL